MVAWNVFSLGLCFNAATAMALSRSNHLQCDFSPADVPRTNRQHSPSGRTELPNLSPVRDSSVQLDAVRFRGLHRPARRTRRPRSSRNRSTPQRGIMPITPFLGGVTFDPETNGSWGSPSRWRVPPFALQIAAISPTK